MNEVIANKHIQVLFPTDSAGRAEPRPGWTGGRYSWMRGVLGSHGKLLYRRRIQMIEPVFAHTKHNPTITRFTAKPEPPCPPSAAADGNRNSPSSTATGSPPQGSGPEA